MNLHDSLITRTVEHLVLAEGGREKGEQQEPGFV